MELELKNHTFYGRDADIDVVADVEHHDSLTLELQIAKSTAYLHALDPKVGIV